MSNKEWQPSQSGGEPDKPLRCGNGNRKEVIMEKWRRILLCALLAACATGLVLSVCCIVEIFMEVL